MSKLDAMRAMREARWEAGRSPAADGAAPVASSAPARKPPPARGRAGLRVVTEAEPAAPVESAPEACGHRNMGGRTCTRPAGHAEKNHRYM